MRVTRSEPQSSEDPQRRIDDSQDGRRGAWARLAGAALVLLAATPLSAQNAVEFAPDISVALGSGPSLTVGPNQLASDDGAGAVYGFLMPPNTLPANAGMSGYHRLANGNLLLSLDRATALPGLPPAAPAEPNDVVQLVPGTWLFSVYFDGAAAGIPAGVQIDGLAIAGGSFDMLFSFDMAVTLPGVGVVEDEDVVRYAGGTFSMELDGSAAGIGSALDLDALDYEPLQADYLLSFDTSGVVGGVNFEDEDVIRYDPGLATYTMYFDGSLSDPVDWPAADLVALPEPAILPGLTAGAALLAACRRRRLTTVPGSISLPRPAA